jgi:hypothetical protein
LILIVIFLNTPGERKEKIEIQKRETNNQEKSIIFQSYHRRVFNTSREEKKRKRRLLEHLEEEKIQRRHLDSNYTGLSSHCYTQLPR